MISQLETYEFPRISKRHLARRFRTAKLKAARFMKAKTRKARSKIRIYLRKQYMVTHAIHDFKLGVQRNEDIFIASLISMLVIGFSAANTMANIALAFMNTAYAAADISGVNMLLMLLTAGSVLSVLLAWIAAFCMGLLAQPVMDGITKRTNRSFRKTARLSLQRAPRIATSWLLLAAMVFAPLAVAVLPAFIFLRSGNVSLNEVITLVPFAVTAAGLWVLYALMQYSLAPYVALFEADVPMKQLLRRSRSLLKRRGKFFMALLYALTAATIYGVYLAATAIQHLTSLNQMYLMVPCTLAVLVLVNGILTVLYRKRRVARVN